MNHSTRRPWIITYQPEIDYVARSPGFSIFLAMARPSIETHNNIGLFATRIISHELGGFMGYHHGPKIQLRPRIWTFWCELADEICVNDNKKKAMKSFNFKF